MTASLPTVEDKDPHYFNYYSHLQHQQNILQDDVRTATYRSAILLNGPSHFKDKKVLDVGAGSGILSFFAAQAGASQVYAVEASKVATKMKKLVDTAGRNGRNDFLKDKITIIQAKVEDCDETIPKVDTIISEPIGVLLFHERMLESYIYARDHYLKPGGTLFPSMGVIHLAPFTDTALWRETISSARFWEQNSFYDIDLSALYNDAKEELFAMPVVGHFNHKSILATFDPNNGYSIDFNTISNPSLLDMTIPFSWISTRTGMMNGIAGWFDLVFDPCGSEENAIQLSTGPQSDTTHWYQTRFLFSEPLAIKAASVISGWMRCVVNDSRSYTIYAEVVLDGTPSDPNSLFKLGGVDIFLHKDKLHSNSRRGKWELHEQTFNHNFNRG